jgi:transposase
VIGVPGNVRVDLACGVTDMRKGFDGLAAGADGAAARPAWPRAVVFRGRRGDLCAD